MAAKYTNKLTGQRVLIIGGTSGIGYGLAEALLEHGASVIVSSSSSTKVTNTVATLEAAYPATSTSNDGQQQQQQQPRISGMACDLGNSATAASQLDALFAFAGELDHVVYTAGDGLAIRAFGEYDVAAFQQAGMVRFFGPLLVAQRAATALKAGGPRSSLTLTSGSVADRPLPGWAVVNAYATGLYGLARGLALDLAPLRVNVVSPGAVDTNLWAPQKQDGSFPQLAEHFKAAGLTGELARVEDVVEAYLYLLKDRNVTGSIVATNSGSLLK